ncbi:MAG: hypothetical protein Q9187_003180 [Circinaria calcarea]
MSGKLDQSLDEILNTRREGARRARGRGGRRAPNPARKSTAAPVDGVKKSTRAVKPAAKPSMPNGSAAGNGESKIIVNNLPVDIDERQIKLAYVKLDAKLYEVKSLSHLANTWLVTTAVWQTCFVSSSADDQKVKPVFEVNGREHTIRIVYSGELSTSEPSGESSAAAK